MMSVGYSKAVLQGMKKAGISPARILKMTGMKKSRFEAIVEGKAGLTQKQIALIEDKTGQYGGQFAALTFPAAQRKSLEQLYRSWPLLRPKTSRTQTLKRAG